MKNLLVIVFILVLPLTSFSQPEKDAKRDYVWLFGYDSNNVDSTFGGTRLDFGTYPVDIYQDNRPMNFSETNASICDEYGNLLFYTNGISIAQANHTGMVNGDGLSPRWAYRIFCRRRSLCQSRGSNLAIAG